MRLMRPMGLMGLIGLMRPMGLMGLIGLIGLTACSTEPEQTVEPEPIPVPVPEMPTDPTKPEEPEVAGVPISFSGEESTEEVTRANGAYGAYGTNGTNRTNGRTRATSLHDAGISAFKVWGYKNMTYNEGTGSYDDGGTTLQTVFPGYFVKWYKSSAATTTTNTHDWEYVNQQNSGQEEQTIKYWDWSARAYRFFGVTGGLSGTYETHESYKTYEIVIPVDASSKAEAEATPYYSKLWFSTGNIDLDHVAFGQPVQLVFVKPIAHVRFMFIYEDPSLADQAILAAKNFGPTVTTERIYQKGTVTVAYPLTGTSTTETITVTPTDEGETGLADDGIPAFDQDYYETESTNDVEAFRWYDVLPAPIQGSYTLTVTVNGVSRSATVPAAYMSWKPGYQYTYIFKVHVDGGVTIDSVQSAFTPWTEVTLGSHTVYNW